MDCTFAYEIQLCFWYFKMEFTSLYIIDFLLVSFLDYKQETQ